MNPGQWDHSTYHLLLVSKDHNVVIELLQNHGLETQVSMLFEKFATMMMNA
jgi:hypothetical protein